MKTGKNSLKEQGVTKEQATRFAKAVASKKTEIKVVSVKKK